MSILEIVLLIVVLALVGLGGAAYLSVNGKQKIFRDNIKNKDVEITVLQKNFNEAIYKIEELHKNFNETIDIKNKEIHKSAAEINKLLSMVDELKESVNRTEQALSVEKEITSQKEAAIELILGENKTFEILQNKRKEIEKDISNFDSVLNEKSKQKLELEKDIKELENVDKNLKLAAKEKEVVQKDTEKLMKRQGELSTMCDVLEENYKGLKENYDDLLLKETALQKVLSSKKDTEKEIEKLAAQLESLKNTHRVAVMKLDGEEDVAAAVRSMVGLLGNYGVDERWNKLVELLEKLKVDYPELKEEFAKIEWSKIYLPAFQKMIKNLKADQPGIYLIRKVGEEEDICYVGKASTSIKDRWYQHAKKMLGVEAKGGEWLYSGNVRPDQFSWEVLEIGTEDLDKKERYWIEFFGCLEKGLNRI